MKVGVLGGGQLSLMLAEAALPLDIELIFIDPAEDACAGTAAKQIRASYDDSQALQNMAEQVDVITYEFENVPSQSVELLSGKLPVYPAANALAEAQDRLLEKTQLADLGIPVPNFRDITSLDDLRQAINDIGLPAVLKTRRFGYDGKGQVIIRHEADASAAWKAISEVPAILEAFMPFDREISVIAVRDAEGCRKTYPLVENSHQNGILQLSVSRDNDPMFALADNFIGSLMESLDYVGVLALELFQVGEELYANEFAPRVHNTGHWTIEGAVCSQFENHIRAVTGLPLGDTSLKASSAMFNCIGEMPDCSSIRDLPGVAIHDYGKAARPGRKVGHITLTADSPEERDELLDHVRQQLA